MEGRARARLSHMPFDICHLAFDIMSTPTAAPPTSATSIAPMLSVRNGARAVEFYKSAFGATEVFKIEDPGGAVVCRLSVEGAEFWVADESPQHANFSPE